MSSEVSDINREKDIVMTEATKKQDCHAPEVCKGADFSWEQAHLVWANFSRFPELDLALEAAIAVSEQALLAEINSAQLT